MKNYFYVAVVAVAALLLVVSLRTIFAFQGPGEAPPAGNGQLAADGDNVGLGTTSPSKLFDLAKKNAAVQMVFKRIDESINSGNTLGRINFTGTDGASEASPHVGSFIQGSASGGNWTSAQSPGNLSFYTTPTGSVNPVKRMTIYEDGLVEFKRYIEIKGGLPAKGKFLRASTDGGRVKWDYWPGDHLWGQGRPGVKLVNSSGECTIDDLKISRATPAVSWEGAPASCPKGWWVCTAEERGTGTCGSGNITVKLCRPSFTDLKWDEHVVWAKSDSGATGWKKIYDIDSTVISGGLKESTNIKHAWVSDARIGGDDVRVGRLVGIDGTTLPDVNDDATLFCTIMPTWCCAYK